MYKDIAIIGAGLSAAVLSNELVRAGHSVTLYEKSRGTGGRMASCRLGDHSANLGAPFIECQSNEFALWLSQQNGMTCTSLNSCDFSGADLNNQDIYIHSDRLSQLTRNLLQGSRLITNTRIGYIWPETDNVILRDTQGNLLNSHDAVVVTAPPQQAVPLLEAVPRFAKIAESVEMSISWVLLIEIDKTNIETDLFSGKHEVLNRMVRQASYQDSEIWYIEANTDWSTTHQDMASEEVKSELLQAFEQTLNLSVSVRHSRTHRWLYSRVINPEDTVLWSEENAIGACSDWLGNGGLEGAWKSALQLADCINQPTDQRRESFFRER